MRDVKILNKPGATSQTLLLEKLDNLIKYQLKSAIFHAGTNNLTNGFNMLNIVKKVIKDLTTKLLKVKTTFSGLITRKEKKVRQACY